MATTVSYSASMRTRKTNSASNAKSSAASQEYYENTYNYVGVVHFAGMGRCSARGAVRPISAERFPEERQTALRFIIRCGTVGSVRRGRLETAAGIRRLRKRNCCAEYPMRSAGNGRERKYLTRSGFCGKCRPFILKMER